MDPFLRYARAQAELLAQGQALPLGVTPHEVDADNLPPVADDAPVAMLLSPHPDDEAIIGGLALRLRRAGWRVVNIGVTLGSKLERREERRAELEACCAALGFELIVPGAQGLERMQVATRREDPVHWIRAVDQVGHLVAEFRPRVLFFPHVADGHPTHQGVHALARHILYRMGDRIACHLIETEFWAPLEVPNLLVESATDDLARLLRGLACHRGELLRNPYHTRLAGWMADNVRRGAELLGGAGAESPTFAFGTLYAHHEWVGGKYLDNDKPCFLPACADPTELFPALG